MKNLVALTFLSFVALGQSAHVQQHQLAQTFEPVDDYEVDVQEVADDSQTDQNEPGFTLAETFTDASAFSNNCWKRAYGRGFGKIPSSCPSGYTLIGAICYENCRSGYSAAYTQCY